MKEPLVKFRVMEDENLLQQLIQLLPYPVFVKDEAGFFVDVNQAGAAAVGLSGEGIIGQKDPEWVHEKQALIRQIPIELENGRKGSVIILLEENNHPKRITVANRYRVKQDASKRLVTQRQWQALLREKELLLREVHHRIKNNMNNMVMMLTLQADAVGNTAAEAALKDARSRIQTMMVIYDKLYRSEDFHTLSVKAYLGELIDEVKSTFSKHERIRVHVQVEDIMLDSRVLFPLGIIMNELFTNAMKYAYQEGQEGSVIITVIKMGEVIELAVQDFGMGMPDKIEKEGFEGFGLEMVEMLALQMGGSLTIERGNGVRFVVRMKDRKS